jgi:hypothetical protein
VAREDRPIHRLRRAADPGRVPAAAAVSRKYDAGQRKRDALARRLRNRSRRDRDGSRPAGGDRHSGIGGACRNPLPRSAGGIAEPQRVRSRTADGAAIASVAPRLLNLLRVKKLLRVKSAAVFFFLFLAPFFCQASEGGSVLDELNLARTRPQDYAAIVEARMRDIPGADPRCVAEAAEFLRRQRPMEPLQSAPGLVMTARQHVCDQGASGQTGHRSANGASPWSRMARQGQWTGRAGENISYGFADARTIVVTLIVDQGVSNRGHRRNIFCPDFKVAGAACGPHARYGSMCVIDFAGGFVEKGERIAMADPWRGAGE